MRAIWAAAAIDVRAVALLAGQQQSQARPGEGGVEVLQLRPNFYMLVGAGGNIAVQVGVDGAVVVDAGSAARAPRWWRRSGNSAPGPIRYVINTSADADHVGGNEIVARAGQTLFTAPDPTGAPDLGGRRPSCRPTTCWPG